VSTRQGIILAAVRALRERGGGRLPPDVDILVRYYAGAEVEAERAARHLYAQLRGHGVG
jgi:hypothetical protein